VLGVGCWVLGVGCWVLGVGCWVLGVGCWVLGVGCWVLGVLIVSKAVSGQENLAPSFNVFQVFELIDS
jgi:hypothetical protein